MNYSICLLMFLQVLIFQSSSTCEHKLFPENFTLDIMESKLAGAHVKELTSYEINDTNTTSIADQCLELCCSSSEKDDCNVAALMKYNDSNYGYMCLLYKCSPLGNCEWKFNQSFVGILIIDHEMSNETLTQINSKINRVVIQNVNQNSTELSSTLSTLTSVIKRPMSKKKRKWKHLVTLYYESSTFEKTTPITTDKSTISNTPESTLSTTNKPIINRSSQMTNYLASTKTYSITQNVKSKTPNVKSTNPNVKSTSIDSTTSSQPLVMSSMIISTLQFSKFTDQNTDSTFQMYNQTSPSSTITSFPTSTISSRESSSTSKDITNSKTARITSSPLNDISTDSISLSSQSNTNSSYNTESVSIRIISTNNLKEPDLTTSEEITMSHINTTVKSTMNSDIVNTSIKTTLSTYITEEDNTSGSGISTSNSIQQNAPNQHIYSQETDLTDYVAERKFSVSTVSSILAASLVLIVAAVAFTSKLCYEGWKHRHYHHIDYLIEGMYND